MRDEFREARTVLARAAWQNPRPWLLAKFMWSVIAPKSLREEVIRRDLARRR
jgi:hypothetical protein